VPIPHIAARRKAAGICGVVLDALQHSLARLQALCLSARTLVTGQSLLEGLYKVRLGA